MRDITARTIVAIALRLNRWCAHRVWASATARVWYARRARAFIIKHRASSTSRGVCNRVVTSLGDRCEHFAQNAERCAWRSLIDRVTRLRLAPASSAHYLRADRAVAHFAQTRVPTRRFFCHYLGWRAARRMRLRYAHPQPWAHTLLTALALRAYRGIAWVPHKHGAPLAVCRDGGYPRARWQTSRSTVCRRSDIFGDWHV